MNEKFKLLALEAKMGTADFDAGSYYVATPAMMQKLCESIVQECADVAFLEANSRKTQRAVLQHFGVEP
jgi:hypothetical protein